MESLLGVRPVFIVLGVLLVLLVGYVVSAVTGFGRHVVKETETLEYTGENAKPATRSIAKETQTHRTLWDWLTLGLISGAIMVVGLVYTSSQAVQQRYVQDQQAKDDALQAYLDQMSALMLDHDLRTSEKNSPERDLARARTLTVVKRQGPESKGDIVNFLYEADLIKGDQPKGDQPIVSLVAAHLEEVQLDAARLDDVNLYYAYLQKAKFCWAALNSSDLQLSNLSEANLRIASLSEADLRSTNL